MSYPKPFQLYGLDILHRLRFLIPTCYQKAWASWGLSAGSYGASDRLGHSSALESSSFHNSDYRTFIEILYKKNLEIEGPSLNRGSQPYGWPA